jgi:hypothetical protein
LRVLFREESKVSHLGKNSRKTRMIGTQQGDGVLRDGGRRRELEEAKD